MSWSRHERIGPVDLYLGDCREVLPALLEKADLLVTDPPYRLTSGGRAKGPGTMSGIFSGAVYDNSGAMMDVLIGWPGMAGPLFEACRADCDAYVMADAKNVFPAQAAFAGACWKLHNLLVWDKGRCTANRWYMKNCEFVLYLWKGRARRINRCGSGQMHRLSHVKRTAHPAEKPVEVMERFILNSSQPGEIVLDPFAGSGATLLAAMRTGRRAIGVESDPRWFGAALERLEQQAAEAA
ncbi:hypothetical protein DDZ14_08430 [Maritimibacter sp. 55A14]|uniref:DNA-methyltransferase n=1 Tax=Maritimibacter sp. 55A14 TaxID=2174844 RepID=UPI000D61A4A9|nr:DNA methyltransferase [Maritimibacter sp. 55A14]PWE32763.1 hypothetical protein DDZ14_08430 [Maritimibacter sp. 55A14]